MPKIINNCAQCAYMGIYYCNHPSRDKSIYAHKERLPSTGIPDDCPLEDAPDIDRLNEEIDRLRDQSQGYKNGQLQMQDICDSLYDANMKHGDWRKEAEAKIDKLRVENARLREVLDGLTTITKLTVMRPPMSLAGWILKANDILEDTK